jgi:hypothetical protein
MIKENKTKLSNPSIRAGGIFNVVTSFPCTYLTFYIFFSIKADKKKSPAALTKKVTSSIPIKIKFCYVYADEATGINP